MFTLHVLRTRGSLERFGLERADVSIGLINPHPSGSEVEVYDFGIGEVVVPEHIVSVMDGDYPSTSLAPELDVVGVGAPPTKLAANLRRAPLRRRAAREVPTTFVTGYDTFARDRAIFWRERGVGSQPLLAAGVFALSTIQTGIASALRLFALLGPHVVANELPSLRKLQGIVKKSGAGLDSMQTGRPRWYQQFDQFREPIRFAMRTREDDELRRYLARDVGMPTGMGLAKVSFTLAIVGQDLGCLDARILEWAFSKPMRKRFQKRIQKNQAGKVTEAGYDTYRRLELQLLAEDSPFYDPADPVGLARSQWMLWESLGDEVERTHTHEELYDAVVDDRLDEL